MGVKRFREEEAVEAETVATAKCLMLLSKVGEATEIASALRGGGRGDRIFECKTCKKQFHTFQALGGHRASHKKLRLMAGDLLRESLPVKPKTHACSVCGLEFPLGQALGGHMRRHRVAADGGQLVVPDVKTVAKKSPFLRRSNSSKRIFGLDDLDLNLTPDENVSKRQKIPPLQDFFI